MVYFTLTEEQMKVILKKMQAEMQRGLELHKENPKASWESSKCSLKMLDTYVTEDLIPKGNEQGSAFSLDLAGVQVSYVRGVKVNLYGDHHITTSSITEGLRNTSFGCPKGLMDRTATASMLFDSLAGVIKKLLDEKDSPVKDDEIIPVGFSVCFPVEHRSLNSTTLLHWTKGYETGNDSNDPVEGMDVAALLDCAFWRLGLQVQTKVVINDTTGNLLTCCYEKPARLPQCRIGFILGGGVNGCFITSETKRHYNYKGCIINCELGGFDKSLPLNDVDLEIDFADDTRKGLQLFEKMVSTKYLGEICRRLIVKIWQSEAPLLAWVRQSMPWLACARVIADTEDPQMETTKEILYGLWEWETTPEQRIVVRRLFQVVFDRSAALAAVAIVALAIQTERLQQAFGGLTCAIEGALYSTIPSYSKKLRNYLELILDYDAARLINFYEVEDGSAKGAGIIAAMLKQ